MNHLYYGDCLTIMRDHMKSRSVDLIYLDPPWNSNRQYNARYKDETGRPLPDQIEAFCDLWTLDHDRERAIKAMPVLMRENKIDDITVEFWRIWMNALRNTQPKLLAYLSYMVERLLYMKVVLRKTGSIYLHCDPTASHYIKAMMDAIFGHDNFQNEIVWRRYSRPKGSQHKARRYGRSSDSILFYTQGKRHAFNAEDIRIPLDQNAIKERYTSIDERGRFMSGPLLRSPSMGDRPNLVFEFQGYTPGDFGWRMGQKKLQEVYDRGDFYFTSKGVPRRKFRPSEEPSEGVDNIWTDVSALGSKGKERMGYATQKPLALLDRIIKASSNPGDVVFDPFCGCATTLEAAQKIGRRWIGIDVAIHAVKRVARVRLGDRCKLVEGKHYDISGVPRNLEGAQDLWGRDKYQFQKWAVEEVDGFVTTRRTADGGIDGRVYFGLPGEKTLQSMALEVKGGKNVGISALRELRGVLENGEALMAGLIVLHKLGDTKLRNFERFMAGAGDMEVMGRNYARMQMLTIEEILEGKRFDTPGAVGKGDPQQRLDLG